MVQKGGRKKGAQKGTEQWALLCGQGYCHEQLRHHGAYACLHCYSYAYCYMVGDPPEHPKGSQHTCMHHGSTSPPPPLLPLWRQRTAPCPLACNSMGSSSNSQHAAANDSKHSWTRGAVVSRGAAAGSLDRGQWMLGMWCLDHSVGGGWWCRDEGRAQWTAQPLLQCR